MISTEQIRGMFTDLENDRIERTISTSNTDKFGQAICAFANDLPNHKMPGYLFLGVLDDGTVQGLNVTDNLLKDIAAIRTDGNIQPQPSMVVEKVSLPEFDLGLVTAFLVKERISPNGAEAKRKAIELGYLVEGKDQKPPQMTEKGQEEEQKRSDLTLSENEASQKGSEMTLPKFPTLLIKDVYDLLVMNRKAQYSTIVDNLGVSESSAKRAIAWLKENGYINKEHSKVKGEWQLL